MKKIISTRFLIFALCFSVLAILCVGNNKALAQSAGSITGTATVCIGKTTALSNAVSGGVWSSSSHAVATIGTGGVVSGIAAGTSIISYGVTTTDGTEYATTIVTVNPLPATITGPPTIIAVTSTATFGSATPDGTWSSSNPATISIDNISGVATGIATGAATITYTLATGCIQTKSININTDTITGSKSFCMGSTGNLSCASVGVSWTSSNIAVATIGVTSGVVTPVATGTALITFTRAGGTYLTTIITVNSLPSAISGTPFTCSGGSTTTLSSASSGGVWSSSNTGIATVNSSGLVTGVGAGFVNITYTLPTGCRVVAAATVGAMPAAITGTATICSGNTTLLRSATPGCSWSSSNTAVGTVSVTGLVRGLSVGNTTISYTHPLGCARTKIVTVNGIPGANAGVATLCVGATTAMSNAITGGTWISSNTAKATVNSASGIVTGVSAGTCRISYKVINACGTRYAITTVTVNPATSAGVITGTATVCAGNTVTFSDGVSGGVWSSGATAIATIGTSGVVTGISGGTARISYAVTGSCGVVYATKVVTVSPATNPGTITGTATVCPGNTTALSNAISGGIWSSATPAIATIGTGGIVTGITEGTATISYRVTGTCGTVYATNVITVNPITNAGTITGVSTVCQGNTTTLNNAVGGGVWSSAASSIATIGTGGIVTGVTGGTATISYAVTAVCGTAYATKVVTVNVITYPVSITGTASVCPGNTTTLSNAVSGGVWSSATPSVATVGTGGIVTGVAAGNTTISYTITGVCGTAYTTTTVTVNTPTTAGAIIGAISVCEDNNITLSNGVSGGVWSSSSTSVATIGTSGVVSGAAAGTTIISYTVTGVCGAAYATSEITVNPTTNAGTITGASTVCESNTTVLSNAVSGGVWSSAAPSIATIGTGGTVTGVVAETVTISYAVTGVCGTAYATKVLTVNPTTNPGNITGIASVCPGSTATLSNAVSGGVWSSGTPSIASVGTGGTVTGVTAGNTTISYTVTGVCGTDYATTMITVNPATNAGTIIGATSVCEGNISTLSSVVSDGVWISSLPSVATVDTDGTVVAIAAGNTTISYMVTGICGTDYATTLATVNTPTNAGSITGTASVCTGSTTTLDNAISGGVWSSGSTSIATVDTDGVVTGVAEGTCVISYTVTDVCGVAYATSVVTVNLATSVASITGSGSICVGDASILGNLVTGGIWSSSSNIIATVDTTGFVTGVGVGTATISYTVTGICGDAYSTMEMTVHAPTPAGDITGTTLICEGSATTMTGILTGGTWSSSSATVATVGTNGIVTGNSAGTTVISYLPPRICGTDYATTTVTVNAPTSMDTISGNDPICAGSNTLFSNTVNGGTWSSASTSIATVDTSGIVMGIAEGTAVISYTVTDVCGTEYATTIATVNPLIVAGTITGSSTVCVGSSNTLSNAVSGGVWSSGTPSVATVGTSGIVSGISAGTSVISYTVTGVCGTEYATITVTVSPVTNAGTISGNLVVCVNSSTTLSSTVSGGVWSSPTLAGAGGNFTGVFAGTSLVSYAVTGACGTAYAIAVATVNPLPASIIAPTSIGLGSVVAFSNAISGGTWSSSNSTIASIDSGSGIAVAANVGTATITYRIATGCYRAMSVNVTYDTVAGSRSFCVGTTGVLSCPSSSGLSWVSSNEAVATIGITSGLVTPISAGATTIIFTTTSGAVSTIVINVHPLPSAITGTPFTCSNSSTTALNTTSSGGTWSSSNIAVATVDTTGIVTGAGPGYAAISYTFSSGCYRVSEVTVGAMPAAITGVPVVCLGSTTALHSATPSCTWSSSDATMATVSSTGVVTGMGAGTATISYAHHLGCVTTKTVTVGTTPGANTGIAAICLGSSTSFSNATSGGTWSSGNTSIATVGSSSGIVTGIGMGTANISYTTGGSCYAVTQVTVGALIAGISGSSAPICMGLATTFTHPITSGTWSSSNPALATVDASTGVVTGVSAGTPTITYTIASGCFKTKPITIHGACAAISGNVSVCQGSTSSLTCATSGGTWTSSNLSVATIGSTSGAVTSVATGTSSVTYLTSAGCASLVVLTVQALPTAISGTLTVCKYATTTLASIGTAGGTWVSSTTTKATVDTASGIVYGVNAGTATITYTWTNGCRRTAEVTVNPLATAGAIVGAGIVAVGSDITLLSSCEGGTWASSDVAKATIGEETGLMTGVSAGSVTITHTTTNSCNSASVTRVFAVVASKSGGVLSDETNSNITLSVYPNPTAGSLTIEASTTGIFTVYAIDGKQVCSYAIKEMTTKLSLPGSLASGIYMCRFAGDDGSNKTLRLVYGQ